MRGATDFPKTEKGEIIQGDRNEVAKKYEDSQKS